MSGLNKVTLIGHLGADPEIRTLNSGDRVANLRLATSESWKDSRGERQERTEWHRIVIFADRLVDLVDKYTQKGSKIYVEGKLQTRKWKDNAGVEKYSTEVVLQQFGSAILLLDGKSDSEDRGDDSRGRGRSGSSSRSRGNASDDPFNDEIPF